MSRLRLAVTSCLSRCRTSRRQDEPPRDFLTIGALSAAQRLWLRTNRPRSSTRTRTFTTLHAQVEFHGLPKTTPSWSLIFTSKGPASRGKVLFTKREERVSLELVIAH